MAQFDLKKASVFFQDGYRAVGTPLVNNTGGYTVGASTMKVDGITGIIPNGATFKLAAFGSTYAVTAHTETLGATTQVTFTPALKDAAADNDALTFGGRRLEMKVGDGNLTYDEKRTIEYKRDRGKLDTVREGDEEPIDIRLDIQWEWLSSAGTDVIPTAEEVLKKTGLAVDWVSSSDDPCEPYAVDIVVEYDPECSGVEAEIITLQDYRYESINHDLKAGTISTSGKSNVTRASLQRVALP